MLEQTQNFIREEDSEIKAGDLESKSDSELSADELALLKIRESNTNQMVESSAKLLKLEAASLVNVSSLNKRDVRSADLVDKENIKKSKNLYKHLYYIDIYI